jgi:CHRD domain
MRQAGPNDGYLRQQEHRRRQQAGRRRLAVVLLVVAVVVVVILAVTLSGNRQPSSSTSTTLAESSESSTTTTPGTGADGSTTSLTEVGVPSAVTYTADLGGGNEIPALTTAASGTLTLTVAADGTSVDYVLKLSGIISPTVARLHEGKTGATGATIFTLYGGPTKSGLYTGTIKEGSFTADDLVGPLKGKTIDDLVAMIQADDVYLNVGTEAHSDGEIRGQLQ